MVGTAAAAQIEVEEAAAKAIHGSAPRVSRQNRDVVSRIDRGGPGADEIQTVHVTCVAAQEPASIRTDDTTCQKWQLLGKRRKDVRESCSWWQHERDVPGP